MVFQEDKSIINIAMTARFEYPESFSRAFKKRFFQSPTEFRNQPNWLLWHQAYQPIENRMEQMMDVKITQLETINVAVLEHHGAAEKVMETAGKFIQWRKQTGLSPVLTSRTFGIIYHDPDEVPADAFRFDIAGEVNEPIEQNDFSVVNKQIAGGRYAVIRHLGSHDHLGKAVYYLYGTWLPQSGEELRDEPCFFHYQNFFPEVEEHQLITDVYLPIN
ncbi:GyrI-like domain-containing protein [Marinomonas sp. 15G1-11]|uniref:GyrI-like domain-containing protein n=1 Tax=Marinomonas phaeophyticola TaxID=3004091 RepID=A0ABT4JWB1_9GAMM|nr:GyrI-like domain-containing protein [Marinomonas sp. 15G1-11]MCZ2722663.1 GyrI-like domain-containing protein [Marinomonas sp. 15G1-11]